MQSWRRITWFYVMLSFSNFHQCIMYRLSKYISAIFLHLSRMLKYSLACDVCVKIGLSVAELQVGRVRAAFVQKPFETSIGFAVHSLLVVDALQMLGHDYELLVASHHGLWSVWKWSVIICWCWCCNCKILVLFFLCCVLIWWSIICVSFLILSCSVAHSHHFTETLHYRALSIIALKKFD